MITRAGIDAKHRLAIEYWRAGFSIIPILRDGSKRPAKGWREYMQRHATLEEVEAWWGHTDAYGIGLVCGAISGGFEVVDFDSWQFFAPWKSLLPESLTSKLTVVETPAGWHVYYRCREICGSRKLACWEPATSLSEQRDGYRQGTSCASIGKEVRIETRGEGGYIVAEGNPCDVHATGLPYAQYSGPALPNISTITPDERDAMWHAAATFDCAPPTKAPAPKLLQSAVAYAGNSPAEWCDRHGPAISDQLERAGWAISSVSESGYSVTRPGKSFGTSGTVTLNKNGEEVLTVFSTSAGQLAPARKAYQCYGRFALLAKLEFGGDRSAAAKHVMTIMGAR